MLDSDVTNPVMVKMPHSSDYSLGDDAVMLVCCAVIVGLSYLSFILVCHAVIVVCHSCLSK